MRKRWLLAVCMALVSAVWAVGGGQAAAEPPGEDGIKRTIGDLLLFPLQQRDVIAIAVDAGMPASWIADPLSYKLDVPYAEAFGDGKLEIAVSGVDPSLAASGSKTDVYTRTVNSTYLKQIRIEKTGDFSVKVTAWFNGKNRPQVTTVKRKRYNREDGWIDYRTYLVLSFGNPAAADKTVVIDPGHGGDDSGAISNNLLEKDLNLDISLRARDALQAKGYDVYMTRTADDSVELFERADAANILNAAAFVSIHNNSMENLRNCPRGMTVLYNSSATQPAQDLAALMWDELADALHTVKQPMQDRPHLLVLNSTWVPAVLAEVSMMPNFQDAKMISQTVYRQRAAEAISAAIDQYLTGKAAR